MAQEKLGKKIEVKGPVCITPLSCAGLALYHALKKEGVPIVAFGDGGAFVQGKSYDGVPVLPREDVAQRWPNVQFIIASKAFGDAIYRELTNQYTCEVVWLEDLHMLPALVDGCDHINDERARSLFVNYSSPRYVALESMWDYRHRQKEKLTIKEIPQPFYIIATSYVEVLYARYFLERGVFVAGLCGWGDVVGYKDEMISCLPWEEAVEHDPGATYIVTQATSNRFFINRLIRRGIRLLDMHDLDLMDFTNESRLSRYKPAPHKDEEWFFAEKRKFRIGIDRSPDAFGAERISLNMARDPLESTIENFLEATRNVQWIKTLALYYPGRFGQNDFMIMAGYLSDLVKPHQCGIYIMTELKDLKTTLDRINSTPLFHGKAITVDVTPRVLPWYEYAAFLHMLNTEALPIYLSSRYMPQDNGIYGGGATQAATCAISLLARFIVGKEGSEETLFSFERKYHAAVVTSSCSACTSVSYHLFGDEDNFVRSRDNAIIRYGDLFDEMRLIGNIRNPWDRMVSEMRNHSVWLVGYERVLVAEHPDRSEKSEIQQIRRQIKAAIGRWPPQAYTDCLYDESGKPWVKYLVRFENLQEDVDFVAEELGLGHLVGKPLGNVHRPAAEVAARPPYWTYYDEETKELVREAFKRDIEVFGYSFHGE